MGSDGVEMAWAATVSRCDIPANRRHGRDARGTHGQDARATGGADGTPAPRRRAFTLLEVILALALTISLTGMIMAFYHRATRMRQILMADMAASAAQRVLMDRWTDDLEGALPYSLLQLGLEGTINTDTDLPELRMVTAGLPGPAIWAVRKTAEDPIPPEHDLQVIIYRLHSFRCEDKHVHVTGLERFAQKVIAPRETRADMKDVTPTMFLPQVRFLNIYYYDGGEWHIAWPMDDWDPMDPRRRNLPVAVQIIIGRQELPLDMDPKDYPYETFRRTIFLTGGAMSLDKTIIRRPGGRGGF